jgi:hypothetical protein
MTPAVVVEASPGVQRVWGSSPGSLGVTWRITPTQPPRQVPLALAASLHRTSPRLNHFPIEKELRAPPNDIITQKES